MDPLWHTLKTSETMLELETNDQHGLSRDEACQRLKTLGPNQIKDTPPPAWWSLLLAQFKDFMVLVLLGATVVSFALGEVGDGVAIVAIVIMNACLGFVQEYRAEQSVDTLKRLTAPTANVLRDGASLEIDARQLVPGDILLMEAGDRVAADARIVEAWSLEMNEAALTGESHPVKKQVEELGDPRLSIGDRTNLVYMGTTVSRGRGRAVVVETGMRTEMGHIAHLIQTSSGEETPLQRRLEQLGKMLVLVSLAIVLVVVVTGLLRGEPFYQMFLTGVSLAVAAIPEGLPAIVTVALALGVQRMIKAHAIVRRLPAVETLGCTTVICSDKTGTLTKNQMTVTAIYCGGVQYARRNDGSGFMPLGQGQAVDLTRTLEAACLATSARLDSEDRQTGPLGHGDPTELALLWAGVEGDVRPSDLFREFQRLGEIPFESERRRMAVAFRGRNHQAWVFSKGAPDVILAGCRQAFWHGSVETIDAARRQQIAAANERMAEAALRVLAVAYRPLQEGESADHWEDGLIWAGLLGMMDPPRPEASEAVQQCTRAGVRTVMITGDHPKTAAAIARQMGILRAGQEVMTGRELDQLNDRELQDRLEAVRVFARVSPPHKLRVVRAFKQAGHVVAMTGDGVNDAPAVKEADIGVAMGIAGTDVTKESSAMILTDDNFATIVRAVREGRAIYDNIRKFIRYLLSCNIGEVLVMFLAAFLGLPLPLLPIQILFINLVTDGLPAMALGVDPPVPGVMDRPPRSPRESVFAQGLGGKIVVRGTLIGVTTLVVFVWGLGLAGMGLREARTLALATLIMSQLFHVFDARAENRNFLELGMGSNPWAVLAVASSIGMLLAIVYVPGLRELFKTDPLTASDWIMVVGASGFIQVGSALRYLLRPMRRLAASS